MIIRFTYFLLLISCSKASPSIELINSHSQITKHLNVRRIKEEPSSRLAASSDDCGCNGYDRDSTTCSVANDRIVGGKEATPYSYPYQAYVRSCTQPTDPVKKAKCFLCGGSVLNRRYIVTAGHCIRNHYGEILENIEVTLGYHNISQKTGPNLQNFRVQRAISHPDYDSTSFSNDIALLRMDKDIEFNDKIRPICLPKSDENFYVGRQAIVTGWGTTRYGGLVSHVLKEAVVEILNPTNWKCQNGVVVDDDVPVTKLCAFETKTDACQGDSGGPLAIQEAGRCELAGIVSYGYRCASKNNAGIYTRVNQYLDFIYKTIKDGGCGLDKRDGFEATTCDLTCTNLRRRSGHFLIEGVKSKCDKGKCVSVDRKTEDLCKGAGYSCEDPLSDCKRPCNLDKYIGDFLDEKKPEDPFVYLCVYGVTVYCNVETRNCCQQDNPSENLCRLVARMVYLVDVLGKLPLKCT